MRQLITSLAAAAALLAPDASAQCFDPDNLNNGGCCDQVDLVLPQFPDITLPANALRWESCDPVSQDCTRLSISSPVQSMVCSQYDSGIRVEGCNGQLLLEGKATLDYTRTWKELMGPAGGIQTEAQVWRFVIKADLDGNALIGGPPGIVPPCTNVHPTAFYYGYVDYVRNCATGAIESAAVLFHGCDWLIHRPGLSTAPGAFHPDFSYAIVAPDTPANPFVPAILPPQPGALTAEAVRQTGNPFCVTEERVEEGVYEPIASGCFCPPSLGVGQATAVHTELKSVCGTQTQSLNLFPTAPWVELVSNSLGRWLTGANYPGPERASVTEGLFLYQDACSTTLAGDYEIFYGGETHLGYPQIPTPSQPFTQSQHFVDMAGNWINPVGGPVALPALGENFGTRHLIYLNPQ